MDFLDGKSRNRADLRFAVDAENYRFRKIFGFVSKENFVGIVRTAYFKQPVGVAEFKKFRHVFLVAVDYYRVAAENRDRKRKRVCQTSVFWGVPYEELRRDGAVTQIIN